MTTTITITLYPDGAPTPGQIQAAVDELISLPGYYLSPDESWGMEIGLATIIITEDK